jgi:3-hydroxyisobutyrate dehydrogenase
MGRQRKGAESVKIAVIGLGRMGHAVAERLSGKHDLVLWNRTPEKGKDLLGDRSTWANTPADAVRSVDAVVTSLADDDALRDLLFGEERLVSSLPTETILVDASTISPSMSAEIDEAVLRYVALPILGAPQAVRSGDAIYLAGGSDEQIDALKPLLDALGGSYRRYGGPSLACAGKLAVNLLLLSGIVTLAEAIEVGRSGGLDDEELRDLLQSTPMLAPGLSNRYEGVFTGQGETWWPPPLAAKDARLANDLASEGGTTLRLTPVLRAAYESAVEMGLADEDIVAVARIYR